MTIRMISTVVVLLLCFSVSAQKLLTSKDTVLMFADAQETKFIQHPVKKGHTLFSIAKHYAVGKDELLRLNPQLGGKPDIKIGERLNIPVPNPAICRYMKKGMEAADFAKLYYIVQAGDNLYHISKRLFLMPVEDIMKRNKLKDANIKVGQYLHVGWVTLKPFDAKWSEPVVEEETPQLAKGALSEMGVALWDNTSNEKGTELTCLHNSSKIDSYIAVTFPATKKRVFVKVLGRLPEGTPDNIKLIMSPATARALGAKDPKILVEIEYTKR